MQNANMKTM